MTFNAYSKFCVVYIDDVLILNTYKHSFMLQNKMV